VAALVRLMRPLEFAAPAVRTAVSRMVRQGRLTPVRLPCGPGYGLTPKCVRRLGEAALRIYRAGTISWRGRRHVIVLARVGDRRRRESLRAWDLDVIGGSYGRWLSEAAELVATLPEGAPDDLVFATRSRLVHGWRDILFHGPGPPAGWPGEKARAYFEQEAARLLPSAAAFVDQLLEVL
jgi:phenylacetic acid degradation operon negative regulatory protein